MRRRDREKEMRVRKEERNIRNSRSEKSKIENGKKPKRERIIDDRTRSVKIYFLATRKVSFFKHRKKTFFEICTFQNKKSCPFQK